MVATKREEAASVKGESAPTPVDRGPRQRKATEVSPGDPPVSPKDSPGPSGQTVTATKTSSEDSADYTSKAASSAVQLKKVLVMRDGVSLIVGIMIGSGIFVSPKSVVQYTGSVGMSLVVWVVTGLLSMVSALCFAELGTTIPRSGCNYVYILEAFGPIPAFLSIWIEIIISRPFGGAIVYITFANYLLQAFLPDCSSLPYYPVRFLAAALLCLLTYINCIGVRIGTRVQDVLAMTKVLALIIIIVAGLYHLVRGNVSHYLDPMEGTVWEVSSIATAFYSTLFAYNGWSSLNYMTEELKDPYKNLPRAIAISMVLVTLVYTLTNVAYYAVLTPAEILSSNAVAVTFGGKVLEGLSWAIAFLVACSTAGSINGSAYSVPRMVHAAAREGHLPNFLSFVHVKYYTPITAVITTGVLSLVAMPIDEIGSLLAYVSFCTNLTHITAILSLLWLRYKEPDRPRPIKVWLGFPILSLAVTTFVTVFPVVQRPIEIAVSLAIIAVGLVIYFFAIHLNRQHGLLTRLMEKVAFTCQVVLQCVPEERCA